MPLYEYKCESCGKKIEAIQKFSDAPLTECSECGGLLEKLLSSPAVHFKGTGWYITDYARRNGTGKSGSSKESDKESSTSASTSTPASDTKSKGSES